MFASAALFAAGCGKSNNEGKIVGKWKLTSMPSNTAQKGRDDFAQMTSLGVHLYMDFRADGSLALGLGADKPGMLELIRANAPGGKTEWVAKYKLKSGDGVEISDIPEELKQAGGGLFGNDKTALVKISINGDQMSMTDKEGTGQLIRMTDDAKKPTAPAGKADKEPGDKDEK